MYQTLPAHWVRWLVVIRINLLEAFCVCPNFLSRYAVSALEYFKIHLSFARLMKNATAIASIATWKSKLYPRAYNLELKKESLHGLCDILFWGLNLNRKNVRCPDKGTAILSFKISTISAKVVGLKRSLLYHCCVCGFVCLYSIKLIQDFAHVSKNNHERATCFGECRNLQL